MPRNSLKPAFVRHHFVSTAELVLGRDHTIPEVDTFLRDIAHEPGPIDVISLTDLPGGNPALPPEALAKRILAAELTPLAHLSGKDGNRSMIEARLHSFAMLGVENLLVLTGDAQKDGFQGRSKPVHDLDSALILALVQAMSGGLEYHLGSRDARTTPFNFFPGAVVNPYKLREPDLMMQLYKMRLKVALGARFLITQVGFNLRKLVELKQYMEREGLGDVPVLANVYVPTATIGRMMQSGELSGCVVTDDFIKRLEADKKPQRLERAALMVAAVKDLGFAGAHIGGFGLVYKDFLTILHRADAIGNTWRGRIEELVFPSPGEFYLLPAGTDGLSNPAGDYQAGRRKRSPRLFEILSRSAHRHAIAPDTFGNRFFANRAKSGFWSKLLGLSSIYRKATLGCQSCGDCVQDHLSYAGCSMRWCYKELRNGPCGGSRADGTCEAHPELPCLWNTIYEASLAAGDDPARFARTLIPPRDWSLDRTNALVNRFAGTDNLPKRTSPERTNVTHR